MPTSIQLVIIEDEPLAADRLKHLISKSGIPTKVVATLESLARANQWFLENSPPDLILSDIQLGDGISFQLFEKQLIKCPVIFTTSYDEYALRAFKVQSLDYLLKPVKQEELEAALIRFEEKRKEQQIPWLLLQEKMAEIMRQMGHSEEKFRERLIVRQGDQLIPIEAKDFAYFFTKNDWVCLVSSKGKQYLIDHTLEELEKMLDPGNFFRLNRQFIAGKPAIQKAFLHLNGKLKIELQPSPEEEVFVSREKASLFKAWWEGVEMIS